ncbi:type VI secretion system baseplate subunit TssK [Chelatococcus sp. GCM10030263]|uniref:type VI secretion system baseplate subunit TssK n=1 Tax=Chelatococcus sp. GCM10030263 TaxID=3273387 RepID=UPI003614C41C
MANYNRVVWSEGMFVRPQHFQQESRYFEQLVRQRVHVMRPYGWGLTELEIDRDLLATRHFGLRRCTGVFEDGTPFTLDDGDGDLAPIALPEGLRNTLVYLTLPLRRSGSVEMAEEADTQTPARYRPVTVEVEDAHGGSGLPAEIRVAKLRLRYTLAEAARPQQLAIPVARIADVPAGAPAHLDDAHIPPVLTTAAATALAGLVTDIDGLLLQRGEVLAQDLGPDLMGASAADLMLMQTINRYRPQFHHISQSGLHHPEEVFRLAIALAGELATLARAGRRPADCPRYRHEDLQASFAPVVAAIRQDLSLSLDQPAVLIPLVEQAHGVRLGQVNDADLFARATFVLAVRAEIATERLLRGFPAQVKIGPPDQIQNLINAALPGVRLRALPVAPRQIRYVAGTSYFECDHANPLWKQIAASRTIAVHVTGDFPELAMELWALKG